tara:strand:- start:432 stop:905 length:474 start_codon:yes stop_codon:yes gene_type:complete
MYNLKIRTYFNLVFFISVISLTSAYFIEYILGYQPCNLCLIERIPYGLSVLVIIINITFNKIEKILVLTLILIFVFSLMVSIYHLGIEQEIFEESSICGVKNANEILSKEELLRQLNKKIVSCKDVTFRIFGFSLTTINILISLFILFISTKILKKI